MRVDYVDEDILNAIKRYTIGWVFYGIESGSNRILKSMRKGQVGRRTYTPYNWLRRMV